MAKTFSLYLIIFAGAMLANREYYQKAVKVMAQNEGILFNTSLITLVLGILLVLFHSVWVADWRLIITLLAWVTFLKGILRVVFPQQIVKWTKIIDNATFYYTWVTLFFLLGIYLAYLGFWR